MALLRSDAEPSCLRRHLESSDVELEELVKMGQSAEAAMAAVS